MTLKRVSEWARKFWCCCFLFHRKNKMLNQVSDCTYANDSCDKRNSSSGRRRRRRRKIIRSLWRNEADKGEEICYIRLFTTNFLFYFIVSRQAKKKIAQYKRTWRHKAHKAFSESTNQDQLMNFHHRVIFSYLTSNSTPRIFIICFSSVLSLSLSLIQIFFRSHQTDTLINWSPSNTI